MRNLPEKARSSVQLAITRGNPIVFNALIKSGIASINQRFDGDATTLHLATIYESIEIVRYLLRYVNSEETENAVDINALDAVGRTALHFACDEGYLEIVSLLLNVQGIEVNIEDTEYIFVSLLI